MSRIQDKMFLYVALITYVLPLGYGQDFRKIIRPSYITDAPELNDENLRDPSKIFNSSDSVAMKWRDPYEMFEPPDDLIPPTWRDPHEMFEPPDDLIPEKWRDSHETFPTQSRVEKHLCRDTVWILHYKRLVNMLLNTASVKTADGLSYKGKLDIKMHIENYSLLTEFASSNEDDIITLQKIDDILSNALSTPSLQHTTDTLLSWKDYIYMIFWNTNSLLCLSCIFILLLSRQFLQANLSLGSVFKRLIFLGWIIDFAFCWFNLLQEAEMNKMVTLKKFSSIPDNCDPKKLLSFWSYIVSFFGSQSDDCKEYYHALHKNNFFSVSPLVVFSHQLGIIASTPAAKLGESLGSLTSGILGQLPWGVNVLLLPVVLVFAAMVICIGFIFLTEKSLGISVLGIFKFNLGNSNLTERNNVIQDVRRTTNTCKHITACEPPMVVEIPNNFK